MPNDRDPRPEDPGRQPVPENALGDDLEGNSKTFRDFARRIPNREGKPATMVGRLNDDPVTTFLNFGQSRAATVPQTNAIPADNWK